MAGVQTSVLSVKMLQLVGQRKSHLGLSSTTCSADPSNLPGLFRQVEFYGKNTHETTLAEWTSGTFFLKGTDGSIGHQSKAYHHWEFSKQTLVQKAAVSSNTWPADALCMAAAQQHTASAGQKRVGGTWREVMEDGIKGAKWMARKWLQIHNRMPKAQYGNLIKIPHNMEKTTFRLRFRFSPEKSAGWYLGTGWN